MGSDWAVSTADPLLEMEVAVTRISDAHRGERPPFLPAERLDLMDALAAFTMGTASVNHLESEVGSIEVGKAADLVVLDRDLFDRGAGAIGEARVVATFIDGMRGLRGARARGLTRVPRAWTDDDVDSTPHVGVAAGSGWAMLLLRHGTDPEQRKGDRSSERRSSHVCELASRGPSGRGQGPSSRPTGRAAQPPGAPRLPHRRPPQDPRYRIADPWCRSSRTIPTGADPPPSALPQTPRRPPSPPGGGLRVSGSGQVGRRVDVADRHAVGIEGSPRLPRG